MKNKSILLSISCLLILNLGCSTNDSSKILENKIEKEKFTSVSNLLPMYGPGTKSKEVLAIDQKFIKNTLQAHDNDTIKASLEMSSLAWDYFNKKDLDTAMKRFNQAWLIDKNNFNSYWGFGVILGLKNQFKESIPHFEKAIEINPSEPNIYPGIASSHYKLYFENNNPEHLHKSIAYLLTNLELNPNYVNSLAQLAALYYMIDDNEKALEYYSKALKLDPKAIPVDLKNQLDKL